MAASLEEAAREEEEEERWVISMVEEVEKKTCCACLEPSFANGRTVSRARELEAIPPADFVFLLPSESVLVAARSGSHVV